MYKIKHWPTQKDNEDKFLDELTSIGPYLSSRKINFWRLVEAFSKAIAPGRSHLVLLDLRRRILQLKGER